MVLSIVAATFAAVFVVLTDFAYILLIVAGRWAARANVTHPPGDGDVCARSRRAMVGLHILGMLAFLAIFSEMVVAAPALVLAAI